MKARWRQPKVLAIDEAREAFGDCLEGSTASATNCADGQSTALPDDGTELPHGCFSGGLASAQYGGCSTGGQVLGLPKACYTGEFVE